MTSPKGNSQSAPLSTPRVIGIFVAIAVLLVAVFGSGAMLNPGEAMQWLLVCIVMGASGFIIYFGYTIGRNDSR
jgi:hypothetical protein